MLIEEISSYRNDLVSNGYHTLFISDIPADQYPNNPPHLLFENVAWRLADCIIHKCYKEDGILVNIIILRTA
jgi:hypothetical protein